MRFWASSGNSAVARRRAAPMSVAVVTGVEAIAVDLRDLRGQPLDESALAEGRRSPPGRPRASRERLAQEGQRILSPGVADGVGHVDDEDGGEPVDRQHDAEPGEARARAREQHGPKDERDPAATAPTRRLALRYSARVIAERDQQQQRERGFEARPIRRPPRPAGRRSPRARRARMSPSRWYSAHSMHRDDEDEQDDRHPQLVAGRRPFGHRRGGVPRHRAPARHRSATRGLDGGGAPGAMVDSSTSNRATTKRTGAIGSSTTGGPDGLAVGPLGRGVARRAGSGCSRSGCHSGPPTRPGRDRRGPCRSRADRWRRT